MVSHCQEWTSLIKYKVDFLYLLSEGLHLENQRDQFYLMDTLGKDDEAMIIAIKKMSDPNYEPERPRESDEDSDISDTVEIPQTVDSDMDRLQKDTALRQHLKIGTAFTGPKGVKQGVLN